VTEAEQRAAVIAEAHSWLEPHTPFHFSASVKGVGVSCGQFLIACYKPYSEDTGRPMPNPPAFPKDWHCNTQEERFLQVVEAFCGEVETPQPGDVALFRLGAPTRPFSHGAIVVEWPKLLIHSMWRSGCEYTTAYQLPLRPELAKFFSPWAWHG
jgi:hypothetical protein